MALFGKKDKNESAKPAEASASPLVGRTVFCGICSAYRPFSRCWRRTAPLRQCACCGLVFEHVGALYGKFQPACPRCGEFLEHPGFDYGLCDKCGSKYELVEGAKPGLLPNKKQRDQMDVHGKVWNRE